MAFSNDCMKPFIRKKLPGILGAAVLEGAAFGAGSSIARMAVNSIFGGVPCSQHHAVDQIQGEEQSLML
jgi:hypothetical protein